MNSLCMSNVTSGFIDLATFDESDKYMYGGSSASTYFVRETRKSTWFSQVPVELNRKGGEASCVSGCDLSFEVSRHGDYFLNTWLRVCLPEVTASCVNASGFTSSYSSGLDRNKYVMWTPNLGHNLIESCDIYFNDQASSGGGSGGITASFLDFWAAFTVPSNKTAAYNQMIGNTSDLCTPHAVLPAKVLYIPLPLWYTRDSGVALPTAALPYSLIQIRVSVRALSDLLSVVSSTGVVGSAGGGQALIKPAVGGVDYLTGGDYKVSCWGTYAIVSNDERQRMGCAPRDILMEQVQNTSFPIEVQGTAAPANNELNFSHAIKALMFGATHRQSSQSNAQANLYSNYTTGDYYMDSSGAVLLMSTNNGSPPTAPVDSPLANISLLYENTNRLANMSDDYFQLINPYYHAPTAPRGVTAPFSATPYYINGMNSTIENDKNAIHCQQNGEGDRGLYLYSYSLDFVCLDPMGSTNYSKLTHVTLRTTTSKAAIAKVVTNGYDSELYRLYVCAINNNIIRISGGQLGFPVL